MAARLRGVSDSREWMAYAPLDATAWRSFQAAAGDVAEGIRRHQGWSYLAREHVKNSYRRTILGPWWLTAQSVLYVLGLAVVFGQLLNQPLRQFLPYVAVGYITYVLLAGLLRAGANVFIAHAGTIKSTRQPLSALVFRSVTIELIQFGHNVLIVFAFFVGGLINLSPWLAFAPIALAVIMLNGIAAGLWLGSTVARFRDLAPAVDSILQVLVFFTPIFYKAADLQGSRGLLVGWNPFTYFVDLFRSAVLGDQPALSTLVGSAAFTTLNLVMAAIFFSRTRSHLPYWVS